MAKDLRPVYTAVNEADAQVRLDKFHDRWGDRYPAIKTLSSTACVEFVPFLDYSPENPPSHLLHEHDRVVERPIPASDPSERALPQRAGSDEMPLHGRAFARPDGTRQERWMNRWKPALNAFAITFEGRLF